ncbi:hypothetical protein QFC22_001847 [Naganishia vaughanmartiniae]|uniref:Uncharacterized protein n=1 Tax=Naganishia vaughanmartiniae TaxID=1424756 RepID=A0ACC2XES3_9TREE|nr:hypothetical protein QFC22_001847 [Naganishia vaughanmartiniae]
MDSEDSELYSNEDEDEDGCAGMFDDYSDDGGCQASDGSDIGDASDFKREKRKDTYEKEGPLADLGKALSIVQGNRGEFSFGGKADFLPPAPGLEIEGIGRVVLPLIDEQVAERIIDVCEQAPFGRGRETLVDTSVRNSWQLDPSKIKLTNPDWATGIQRAIPIIAKKLGVEGTPLTLHPYKFLLYKKGGHFTKHRDTEKEDRMFATMVIQLPSVHQGGQLQVFKDGSEDPVIHDFGAAAGTAEYRCNYAVHYADAEHAVTPITDGYRLALIYSICWPVRSSHPAPTTADELYPALLKPLAELANADRAFHYYLKHEYTYHSMSDIAFGSLKGEDRARVQSLRTANEYLPPDQRYNFYLLQGKRHASYFSEDYTTWNVKEWALVEEPKYKYGPLLDLEGKQLRKSYPTLADADVLNPDHQSRYQRWSGHRTKTYEGSLGNEGAHQGLDISQVSASRLASKVDG